MRFVPFLGDGGPTVNRLLEVRIIGFQKEGVEAIDDLLHEPTRGTIPLLLQGARDARSAGLGMGIGL